jgi:hypothetical protein
LTFNVVDEVSFGNSNNGRDVRFVCSLIVRLLSSSRNKAIEAMSVFDYFQLDALFIVIQFGERSKVSTNALGVKVNAKFGAGPTIHDFKSNWFFKIWSYLHLD